MTTRPIASIIKLSATALVALAGFVTPAFADFTQQVSAQIVLPVSFNGSATITCDNSPGPEVTLSGDLVLGGLKVAAIFRNNQKGTHTRIEEVTYNGELLPPGQAISIPKQPVRGGAGGNPFVWVQFLDGYGKAVTAEIYLGRCVQGLAAPVNPAFALSTLATSNTNVSCSNNPGPWITVSGNLVLPGLKVRYIFRNSDNPVGGPHKADIVIDTTLIAAGTPIVFPKQPSLGGVGGNPWIYTQFLYSDGSPASDEYLIGRCVQLSK